MGNIGGIMIRLKRSMWPEYSDYSGHLYGHLAIPG